MMSPCASLIRSRPLVTALGFVKLLWRDHSPRFLKMPGEFFIADARHFDSNPPAHSYVRRAIKLSRRLLDECFLHADGRGHGHRNVAVVVMIVREHGKYFLANKPCRLAMRNLFPRAWQREAHMPNAPDLLLASDLPSICHAFLR